jgi:molybdenum cofactor cytidylyltransferase
MKDVANSPVGAVILAAGKSSRMGKAKQLLRLGESTVLVQTLKMVRRSAVGQIVLVLGSSAAEIFPHLSAFEDIKVVINRAYGEGMASSLQAGVSALNPQTEAALIVLGDQPFIRAQTLNRIVQEYSQTKSQVIIPTYKGARGNPVLLDRAMFSAVMALEGDVGCRAIFKNYPEAILKLEVEDAGILLDINNQDEYEQVRTLGEFPDEQTIADLMAEKVSVSGRTS